MANELAIEDSKCVDCESCVEICPEVFRIDQATGKIVVHIPADEPKKPKKRIKEALKACPAGCIHWK